MIFVSLNIRLVPEAPAAGNTTVNIDYSIWGSRSGAYDIRVFWDVTPYQLMNAYRRFEGLQCRSL
jgi:hypothetical protein